MNENWILLVLGTAYIIQVFLSNRQLLLFRKNIAEVSYMGKLLVGKRKGVLRGAALILAISSEHKIIEARGIRGATVFAKIEELPEWKGRSLSEIQTLVRSTPWERPFIDATVSININLAKESTGELAEI